MRHPYHLTVVTTTRPRGRRKKHQAKGETTLELRGREPSPPPLCGRPVTLAPSQSPSGSDSRAYQAHPGPARPRTSPQNAAAGWRQRRQHPIAHRHSPASRKPCRRPFAPSARPHLDGAQIWVERAPPDHAAAPPRCQRQRCRPANRPPPRRRAPPPRSTLQRRAAPRQRDTERGKAKGRRQRRPGQARCRTPMTAVGREERGRLGEEALGVWPVAHGRDAVAGERSVPKYKTF
nr:serine/arginine repetitive matrix protein 1-like [Aegilops tauschii subsp. strangulata]